MNNGIKCPDCGGMNVIWDLETNQIFCIDCKSKPNKPKKFNLDEYKANSILEEENRMNRERIFGTKIKIEPKLPEAEELNNFTHLSL